MQHVHFDPPSYTHLFKVHLTATIMTMVWNKICWKDQTGHSPTVSHSHFFLKKEGRMHSPLILWRQRTMITDCPWMILLKIRECRFFQSLRTVCNTGKCLLPITRSRAIIFFVSYSRSSSPPARQTSFIPSVKGSSIYNSTKRKMVALMIETTWGWLVKGDGGGRKSEGHTY